MSGNSSIASFRVRASSFKTCTIPSTATKLSLRFYIEALSIDSAYRLEDELGLTNDSAIGIDPVKVCIQEFAFHNEVHPLGNRSSFNHDGLFVELERLHPVEVAEVELGVSPLKEGDPMDGVLIEEESNLALKRWT